MTYRILHLWADLGIEDEVLATFGDVYRVGIDPEPNPYSTAIQADARDPPLSGTFDLTLCSPRCQRWSIATIGGGNPDDHPDEIDAARAACRDLAEHYIIENVPRAPLRDPTVLRGGMFGLPIDYPRAFETSFRLPEPSSSHRFRPSDGPLAEQGSTGNAWVGETAGWRLAKGYADDWPGRDLKRHAIPAPYLRRILYWWLAALDGDERSVQQSLGDIAEVSP